MAAYSARRSGAPVLRSNPPPSTRQFSSRTPSFRQTSPAVSFSLDQPLSPNRRFSVSPPAVQKGTCMCSPTNHPGSFRCSLHKAGFGNNGAVRNSKTASYASSTRLSMRRSAMTNSLVRIGTVEGDLVRRALAALIRPSSHHQRRRGHFRPCASRLSRMSR
ncbi:hypothetical protein F511_25132 [Dorcoceras hygrometricum]|uniref:Serine-rich protein-related n=1 Tax=Dorcoceras hygrometricum TaxID=472368 RepID=A0A2Z7BNV1_9LAMI|nr:hypothetical protein F511_25132 [Dorcoceras hygrometricum]